MDMLLQVEDVEEVKDKRVAIISSGLSLAVLFLILIFKQFAINPPLPIDTPPLNSDEVIEEFMIDNLEVVQEAEAGGSGGGTPTNDRVDVPKPQSEKIVTQKTNTNNKVFSGNSNNQNSQNNSTNSSSTTQKAKNPFGDGGDGGGSGGGSGGRFGNDQGTGGSGPGGSGNGAGRTRLNNVNIEGIETNTNVTIYLRLTINENGDVVSAKSLSKTTTTDQRIINQLISEVKKQVKYSKDPGSGFVQVDYTVRINAT